MKIVSSSSFGFSDPYRERIKPLLREVLAKWMFEMNTVENREKIRLQIISILKSNTFLRESQVVFHVLVHGELSMLEAIITYTVAYKGRDHRVTITATIDAKPSDCAVSNA